MDPPRLCPFRPFSERLLPLSEHFLAPFAQNNYFRPWWNEGSLKDFGSRIIEEKESYKICLDVQHYLPEEISVKVTDHEIIVEAKHEEREDKLGFISRQFKRRYLLPKNCPADNITSTLSSDGVLTVLAPKNCFKDAEKIVQVKFCGFGQNVPKSIREMTKQSVLSGLINELDAELASKEPICTTAIKELDSKSEVKNNVTKTEVQNWESNRPKEVEPKHEKILEPMREKVFEATIFEDSEPISGSGVTQKDIDDAIREANELISRNKAQQHNRLVMSQLLGDSTGTEALYSHADAISKDTKEFMENKSSETSTLTEQFAQTSISASSQTETLSVNTTETQSQESSLFKESENISSVTELSKMKDISAELKDAAENV